MLGLSIFTYLNPKKALKLILPDLNKIAYIDAKIKGDSLFTNIDLSVKNTSFYNLVIDSIYYKVKLSEELVAEELVSLDISQKKFETDTIRIPLNVPFIKIRKKIKSMQDRDSTAVDLKFYVIYKTPFGKSRFDFQTTEKIAVPIPPEIKVLEITNKKYKLLKKELDAKIRVEVLNKGKNIDMEIMNINYHFKSNLFKHKKQTLQKKVVIKPKATVIIDLPISVEVIHPLRTIVDIAKDKEIINYEFIVDAEMMLGTLDNSEDPIPIHFEAVGKIDL